MGASVEPYDIDEEAVALDPDNNRRQTLIYLFSTLGVLLTAGGAYYFKNRVIKKRNSKTNTAS